MRDDGVVGINQERGKPRVSFGRDRHPLGIFPLLGGTLAGPCQLPRGAGARRPVSQRGLSACGTQLPASLDDDLSVVRWSAPSPLRVGALPNDARRLVGGGRSDWPGEVVEALSSLSVSPRSG